MQAGYSLLPGVAEKMVENIHREFRIAANLHDFPNTPWVYVVDVPANDFAAIVANNNLSKIAPAARSLHKAEKPSKRAESVFSLERIALTEIVKALQKRFGVQFASMQMRLGQTEGTRCVSDGDAVGDLAERIRGKPNAA